MSKSKAVQWPVLVTNSVSISRSITQSVIWKPVPRYCNNVNKKTLSSRIHITKERSTELPPAGWRSGSSNVLLSSPSSTTSTRHYSSRISLDSISCMCSFGYFSPLLSRFLSLRRTTALGSSWSGTHQTRLVHSSRGSNAQPSKDTTLSKTLVQSRTRTRQSARKREAVAQPDTDASPTLPNPKSTPLPPPPPEKKKKLKPLWMKKRETLKSSTTKSESNDPVLALNNFRVLIHSDHSCTQHLRLGSQVFREKLATGHRLPSSIIPPLSALQQLYSHLEDTGLVGQLRRSDWNSFIFWLSHHKDYRTMSHLHGVMFSNEAMSTKCSTLSFTLLTKAHLELIHNDQSTPGHSEQESTLSPSPSPSTVVQNTINLMMASNVPRSSDMYGLWLQESVQEKSWLKGIEGWVQMKADKKRPLSPSIAMVAYVIQCYLNTNYMAEAATLFKETLERSSSAQQRQNYAMVRDGGLLPETSGGNAEGERDFGVLDGRLEFMKRLNQAFEGLSTLQQKSVPTKKSNSGSSNSNHIQEWKEVINPALIEAICLDEKDSYGASVATELAMELFNQGHVLDRTRFRYLAHYVGACKTAAGAEAFMRHLMEVTRLPFNMTGPSQSPKDEHGSRSISPREKESRRTKRIIESTSRILIEVGLQEVVKQASVEGNFNLARRIFQGMVDEGISLGADASEKLILGLTGIHDFRMALRVLEKALQENRVPTITTVNVLFKGLIRHHMLDEAVAVFRELTENHSLKPDLKMYRNLLNLTSAHGQLGMAQRIISTIRGLGVEPNGEIYRDMMLCYVRVENLQGAIKVFELMNQAGIKNEITHINVLLEGAARYSSSTTILGMLEIMASQEIHPNAVTWRILLSGAFRAKDRVVAREIYQELIHSVVEGIDDKAEGALRASRHPETFQLLLNQYADRHGVESALSLLKGALEGGYPSGIASSMYRELIDKSCIQGKGVAGYGFYRLLRRSQRTNHLGNQTIDPLGDKMENDSDVSSTRFTTVVSSTPAHAITPTSPTVVAMSFPNLFWKLMTRLDQEGQTEIGAEMATDLILSEFEMNQELIASAIRFYAKSGELAAAFGLFMKMGNVYKVEPTQDMVQDLYAATRVQGLSFTCAPWRGSPGSSSSRWDENVTQQWMKGLREAMEKVGLAVDGKL